VRRGYELNYPLLPVQTVKHSGNLPEHHSFLELKAENVVLTAAKKAEDDGAIIFRFYEWAGKEGDIVVRPDFGVTSAEETDLMERPAKTLTMESGGVKVATKPFEIKTVRLGPAGTQITTGEARSTP
jgi:alpha-mannosidase